MTTNNPIQPTEPVTANRTIIATAPIVCLCGSVNKFPEYFRNIELDLSQQGYLVLSPIIRDGDLKPPQRFDLAQYHKRKIDIAQSVLIINVNGYIGQDTEADIRYAQKLGKQINYMVQPKEKNVQQDKVTA